ncbi:MAG TPA: hypothetical protein VM124_00395 [Candidatus Limnocylindrales bacterium]|nr:hypothetical protein [Candidatus Limnocylindrales bacterium]
MKRDRGEQEALGLVVTQHNFPRAGDDMEKMTAILNTSARLQYEAGAARPDVQDYADVENAVSDLMKYTEFIILTRLLEEQMPFPLEQLTNADHCNSGKHAEKGGGLTVYAAFDTLAIGQVMDRTN